MISNTDLNPYHLKGKIMEFQGTEAILVLENNEQIKWPIKNLPEGIQINDLFRLVFSTQKTDEQEKEILAKKILNEILNH